MRVFLGVAAVVGLLGAALVMGATSAETKLRGYPRDLSATPVARAMARDQKLVRRAVFSARPPSTKPAAVSTTRLAGFPTHGKSFAVLSTGYAHQAADPDYSASTGVPSGGPSIRGARDVTIVRIDLRVPSGHDCLSFDFRFLSEEYPEFIGDIYNDAFIAELGLSSWKVTATKGPLISTPVISSPLNFASDTDGSPIRIRRTGFNKMTALNAKGTTYDGATRKLRASTRVQSGERKLYLSIFDGSDRGYDSAVFLDNLRTSTATVCQSGVRAAT